MAVLDRLLAPNSPFQSRFFFLARRFVAGETIETALEAVRGLNADGITATLDFLGEDVLDAAEAQRTREAYLAMLAAIERSGAQTNVSVKLTALGLLIDDDLCTANLTTILERAAPLADPFVRIDMEGSAVTSETLRVFERVYAQHRNVGPVIQAYLKRSADDIAAEDHRQGHGRVRLCKGAYQEPADIAFQDMPAIRREYLRLAEALLTRGVYPGIATHDEKLILAVKEIARSREIANDRFEFQLLYGVRPELQRALVAEGYRVRVYVPFGTHWAGYFYRRIMERRENALFVIGSLLQK